MQLDKDQQFQFNSRIYKPIDSDCWIYTVTNHHGYGHMTIDKVTYAAHRLAYEMSYGPFDTELFVLHTCDNKACVNPKHLFLGTHIDNMKDMIAKGRHPGYHLTTPEEREKIKELAQTGKRSVEIANIFDISTRTVDRIITNGYKCPAKTCNKDSAQI